MLRRPARALSGIAGIALLVGVAAIPSAAQPVVQPLPDPAAGRLSDALRELAGNPESVEALVQAGLASLTLGDPQNAMGFLRRAQAIAPSDGRVKAGLATIMVRQRQPAEALQLFAEAASVGVPMAPYAADRGLAFDLVGDNASAQQAYAEALRLGQDPELVRRMALSQAIAGDRPASEATLLPLLQRTDLAAYRTRAFALAILGETDEAVSIAETMLPERIAAPLAPYLRYMPRLTRAQQAAAANLGDFPRAEAIGRDSPEVAALSANVAPVGAEQAIDARLVPSGPAMGQGESEGELAPAASQPVPAVQRAPLRLSLNTLPRRPAAVLPPPAPVWQPPAPPPAPATASTRPEPVVVAQLDPPFSGAQSSPEATVAPAPVNLGQIFAEFAEATTPASPAVGAVDITQFVPRREAPPPPPEPPPVPSRVWVQVATGRDVTAFSFDWRRIRREAGDLLNDLEPHVAVWGETNRLLAGPLSNAAAANELVARLKEASIDSFRFTSGRGEEVRPLE